MSFAQEWGSQIKAAREARGWTQAELAKRCGVGRAQVCKLEADIRKASMGLFLKVLEVFGYNLRLLDEAGESAQKLLLDHLELFENVTGNNVRRYMEELSKPASERTIPHVDVGRALDSVVNFILKGLNIKYDPGTQEYDYRFKIGHKEILLCWKMGNLKNDEYRNNLLSEVTRAFADTHADEFIVAIPDHPPIAEEMNSKRYKENLVFVPINSLDRYLKAYLGK